MSETDDLGFDDLDALISEALLAKQEAAKYAAARKRLSSSALIEVTEAARLRAFIEHYEETRLWNTTANVALVHRQHCTTCGAEHRLFMGWMREQRHRERPGLRRLTAGRTPAAVPMLVETHDMRPVEQCPSCLRDFIAAQAAMHTHNGEAL